MLLDGGLEPEAIRDRFMELDDEERCAKRALALLPPPPEPLAQEAVVEEYRAAVCSILAGTTEGNYAYKQEVRAAVRKLVDSVIIFPRTDPDGRDVELVGDIRSLVTAHEDGMETVVAGA